MVRKEQMNYYYLLNSNNDRVKAGLNLSFMTGKTEPSGIQKLIENTKRAWKQTIWD